MCFLPSSCFCVCHMPTVICSLCQLVCGFVQEADLSIIAWWGFGGQGWTNLQSTDPQIAFSLLSAHELLPAHKGPGTDFETYSHRARLFSSPLLILSCRQPALPRWFALGSVDWPAGEFRCHSAILVNLPLPPVRAAPCALRSYSANSDTVVAVRMLLTHCRCAVPPLTPPVKGCCARASAHLP